MRRSLKSKRNQAAFEQAQQEIAVLHEQETKGELDVYYYDESGLALRQRFLMVGKQAVKRRKSPQVGANDSTYWAFSHETTSLRQPLSKDGSIVRW